MRHAGVPRFLRSRVIRKVHTTARVLAMSVTITAVANPPAQATDFTAERALQEFAVNLQNGAASGVPQLANPAALASELLDFLRGYVERAKNAERAARSARVVADDGTNLVQTAALDPMRPDQHGGPARERLEPPGADSALSPAARAGLAELQRVNTLLMAQMDSLIEGTLLAHGTSSIMNSFNELLRGQ